MSLLVRDSVRLLVRESRWNANRLPEKKNKSIKLKQSKRRKAGIGDSMKWIDDDGMGWAKA